MAKRNGLRVNAENFSTQRQVGTRKFGVRSLLGLAFLLFQASMIVYARFVPWRYFCWAPNDYNVEYTLQVVANGQRLTEQQARQRYQLSQGVYHNPAQHIIGLVVQYEQTYGRNDHADVVLRYRVNGREEREWRYPAD